MNKKPDGSDDSSHLVITKDDRVIAHVFDGPPARIWTADGGIVVVTPEEDDALPTDC